MSETYFIEYIKQLRAVPVEQLTEHSKRNALEVLLNQIAKLTDKSNKIKILHEPRRIENYGSPDFLIYTDCSIIGYVENKKITENLDKTLKSEQIKKYRELSDNILLTNYIEFIRIKGDSIFRETLCEITDIENYKFTLAQDKVEKVKKLIIDFFSEAPQKITNPKELALALAVRCKNLKGYIDDELNKQENEIQSGLLLDLFETFKNHVFHELSISEFSDAFAQMLVYGLFLAKLNADTKVIDLENIKKYIPSTFQLIKELVVFLDELEKTEYKDTKWIIDEILSIMNNLDLFEITNQLSFSKRIKDKDDIETDPYMYFYEAFLASYDKELRKAKGVYYTPQPEVNLIVRLVNDVLKEVFEIPDGLADYKKVTALDFATGTGTFIIEMFKIILDTIPQDSKAKRDLIIKEHLLKNIFGFEYLIAPYTIAHLKLSQFLKEKGYEFRENERLQVYLTNTLEPMEKQFKILFLPQLTKETQSAQEIKEKPILVITGNPPYSGHSKNTGEWITNKIKDYFLFDGKPLGEKNPKWLQDDYVKFIRFAQDKMDNVEQGVIGIITNHSFLDNPTFRGMRQSLMRTFDRMYFIDLHGNSKKKERCPDGTKDENVFDIEQGVAISILIKKPGIEKGIYHTDFWGTRKQKFIKSYNGNIKNIEWQELNPSYPFLIFKKQNEEQKENYYKFWSVKDIFHIKGVGITTAHDDFVIDSDRINLLKRFNNFRNSPREKSLLHKKFDVKDKIGWDILKGWDNLQPVNDLSKYITKIHYRPFDIKYIFYESRLVWRIVKNIMLNMQDENISLITHKREELDLPWSHSFVSSYMTEHGLLSSKTTNYQFPLYILKNGEERQFFGVKEPEQEYLSNVTKNGLYKSENFTPEFRKFINGKYPSYSQYSPEEILGFIYGVLHSPTYRAKYAEFLKMDFPRIPFCDSPEKFEIISKLGWELIQMHLMKVDYFEPEYMKYGNYKGNTDENMVVKPEYINGKLFINKIDYFDNVPSDVFNFYIGGYQVLDKFLKDRMGKSIFNEFTHIENIIRILAFTIDQMRRIDLETMDWI